jgi:competence protein ComFC
LYFPPKCVVCRKLLDITDKMDICGDCYDKIPFYEGTPLLFPEDGFDALISLCRYEGPIRRSIINYKFYGKEAYFRTFADLLHERLCALDLVKNIDLVISVPLHPARFRKRGYNQAALISSALAKKLAKPEISKSLKRERNTLTQSTLPGHERAGNIRGAFRFKGDKIHVCGKCVLLVDDILTTGSTMGECSRVLKEAGAARVIAAVIATSRTGLMANNNKEKCR